MNELSRLKPPAGAVRKKRRVGRGVGSGRGKTSGKGQKGQKARSGGSVPPGFEGGQMPIQRRLPKFGFTNIRRVAFAVINLRDLDRFEGGAVVDLDSLAAAGMIRGKGQPLKVLGSGEVSKALTVKAHAFSGAARTKIEAAGGSVEVVGG